MQEYCELSKCKNCGKIMSKYSYYYSRGKFYKDNKIAINCSNTCKYQQKQKGFLNDDFFAFNKPEYCYLLGWLLSDGCLSKHRISLQIAEEDAINIKNSLSLTGVWNEYFQKKRKKHYKNIIQYMINIQNIAENFYNIDFHLKNITMPQKILDIIPKKYIHILIRGLLDGDGCWYFKSESKTAQLSIYSNFNYDWTWLNNIIKNLGINASCSKRIMRKNKLKKDGSFYGSSQIRISNRKSIINFGNWIYQDNIHLKLDRKYEKYLQIKS